MHDRKAGRAHVLIAGPLTAIFLLAACNQGGATPTPEAQPTQPARSSPVATAAATAPATVGTPQPSSALLTILEPVDGSVVETSSVTVRGRTIAGADVSVDGELITADVSGNFSYHAALEPGANVFDITATDDNGNEATQQLVVFYAPAP